MGSDKKILPEICRVRFSELSGTRLAEVLNNMKEVRIGVLGDGTLDIYWDVDMTRSTLSRETPYHPYPVTAERFSPGGGANVAVNLAGLGVGQVSMLTLIGTDWRGSIFRQLARERGIKTDYIIEAEGWITPAYCKPLLHGYDGIPREVNRVDFTNSSQPDQKQEQAVLQKMEEFIEENDAVLLADQLETGIITPKVRKQLLAAVVRYMTGTGYTTCSKGKLIVADSRDAVQEYGGLVLKPNHLEACQAVNPGLVSGEGTVDQWLTAGVELSRSTGSPVLMTMGAEGAAWIDGFTEILVVPAVKLAGPLDVVGAGDTYLAAFASACSAGADIKESMITAALAASVVVRKIQATGTAAPEEIRAVHRTVS